jgi:endothelin-converting enzyme/putative endopeptidase
MASKRVVLLWCVGALGCAQTQVAPGPAKPKLADAGVQAASAVAAPPDPVVPGAPPLVHFDPSVVDPSINPCVDWYAHVCSRWMAANPIPASEAVWGTSSNLEIWNQTVLRNALEKASRPDPQRSPTEQKIGDHWAACMDEPAIEAAGATPIAPDLKRIAALGNKRAIAGEIARLHASIPGATAGLNSADTHTQAALFGLAAIQDFADATKVVANLDQGGMALPSRDYYLSDDAKMKSVRKKYAAHVEAMFTLAGASAKQARTDAAAVIRIETALARGAMDVVKRRDPHNVNNVRSLAQVQSAAPSLDWKGYLRAVHAPAPKHFIVSTPGFLSAVDQTLRKESLSAWKAYLRWWTLHGNAPYLSRPFVDASFDFFDRILSGTEELLPRWRRCVGYADRDLGEAVGKDYVEVAFPPQSKTQAQALVKAVEASLGRSIEQNDWMSAATKVRAMEKLHAIEDKIGYPAVWRDYSALSVGRSSLVQNVHAAAAFELHRQLAKIGQPVDRGEWTQTPPTVNAYYDAQLNTINFPAGILQPPYFALRMGEANFGAIGMIIGHEIVHGFDDQGRKFDAKGNLRDWWTPEDARRYEELGRCISDQYTQEIPELGVKQNGLLTQGEDTADNGGLRLAYDALASTLAARGGSLDAKGSDGLTNAQRFFVAHAFGWCTNIRPEIARRAVATNPHSLDRFRVNNVVANMPEFAKAYSCKKGQPMVRENACRIW